MSQKKLQAKIEILKQLVADLEEEKERGEHHVNDPYGSNDGEKKNLKNWLEETKLFMRNDSPKKFVDQDVGEQHGKCTYSFMLCLNPYSPYQLSKKVVQYCKKTNDLLQQGRKVLEGIPRRDPIEAVDRFECFESRKYVLDKILEAVQCCSINTIRVYGESGTGKTMLVREVKRKVEERKLFDAVVMATVAQNPRIRDEIACDLGVSNELTYQESSNPRKVRRLAEKKVLLILDDIWKPEAYWKLVEELPLEDENENRLLSYKILLITRDNPILSDLSEIQFEIKPLNEGEAWELFKKIATNRNVNHSLPFYARQICKKCFSLPIAIATLANAWKSDKLGWRSTLQELESHPSPYPAFKLSYGCLKSSELQQTFFLCSLMGHNVAVQDLLKYTLGLGLFPGVNSMEEARNLLLNLMTGLRDFSLLLDSGGNMRFDMHDLVMVYAKLITFEEVRLNDWEEMESISWVYLSNSSQLPNHELNCRQLTFFHLSEEDPSESIPPDLFRGTRGLRVLGLTKTYSMPQSISHLTDLQTLRLDQSVLRDADMGAIIRKLLNLQVLSLVGCDLEELPEQIGQLANLKLLDLTDCTKLKVIPPNVLSSLYKLEELYMRNSFDQWAEGVKEQKEEVASLFELKQLLKLTTIEVRINQCNIQDLFSENLARYKIFNGDLWHSWDSSCGSSKILKLKLDAKISPEHSVQKLIKKTEELHLQGLSGFNDVVNELDVEGFQDLKYLLIQNAQNQYIINSMKHDAQNIDPDSISSMKPALPVLEVLVLRNLEKMEKICHGLVKKSSFSKLIRITVDCCNQLKNLFSFSIARRNLLQLQEIRVTKCSNMEAIVDDEEQGDKTEIVEATEQPTEKQAAEEQKEWWSLTLEDLPGLISFNSSCKRMTLFKEQVASSSEQFESFSAGKLKKLIIRGCDNLEYIFSSSMARGLNMLEHLEISKCRSLKEVIFTNNNEEERKELIFHQLNILQIEDLEGLVNFYSRNCIVEFKTLKKLQVLNCPKLEGFIANTQTFFNEQVVFPDLEFLRLSLINMNQIWHISSSQIASIKNIKNLCVKGCGNLEYLLTSSMVKSFEQLMVLKISDCKMMKGVIKEEDRMCEISFPKLDTLELEDLAKLPRFYLRNSNATISEGIPSTSIKNVVNTYISSLFHEKVEFPKLKLLRLSSINIQQIWDFSIPKIPSFVQNLKKLFVEGCGQVKYLLTSSMVMSFKQLILLKICDCDMMEAVIDLEEPKEETISFPELNTLELINLPKLTRFYHAKNTDTPFLFDEKVRFPKLKFLSLSSINIQQIWQISIPKISLEKLSVKGCGCLKYVLMPSMVESFKQLTVLKICDCKMMEQVIVSNELVKEEMMCESFFSKLDTLELEELPKLARLCHGNHSKFKFSKLKRLTISKCAVLKTLIGDNAVSTKNVENTYTSSLFDEKVEFPILEQVIIKFMGSWYKIWDDKHDVNSFSQLNSLTVDSCEKLLNIFPYSMLERVRQKLGTLKIQNCDSLEEIFTASQPQAQITQPPVEFASTIVFLELRQINLSKLPKLKGFIPQFYINKWPSLKQLRVYGCYELQIFASELSSFLEIKGDDESQIQWISERILLYKRSGKICYMLPARHLVIGCGDDPRFWRWFESDSGFPEVAHYINGGCWFEIDGKINTRLLSPKTHYKAYLVFKLLDETGGFRNEPIEAVVLLGGADVSKRRVFVQAESGIVGNGDQYPKERGGNWFEVELGEIELTKEKGGDLKIHLEEVTRKKKRDVIIQGVEIRPN